MAILSNEFRSPLAVNGSTFVQTLRAVYWAGRLGVTCSEVRCVQSAGCDKNMDCLTDNYYDSYSTILQTNNVTSSVLC
jgi:hypothetical protein